MNNVELSYRVSYLIKTLCCNYVGCLYCTKAKEKSRFFDSFRFNIFYSGIFRRALIWFLLPYITAVIHTAFSSSRIR